MENTNKFYVYIYLDPRKKGNFIYGEYEFNYEPFYVGKGSNNRCYNHLLKSNLNNKDNLFKSNKIKKIIKLGYDLKKGFIIKQKENMTETLYRSLIS